MKYIFTARHYWLQYVLRWEYIVGGIKKGIYRRTLMGLVFGSLVGMILELFVRVLLAVVRSSFSLSVSALARLATWCWEHKAEKLSIRTRHWSAVTAVISTVRFGNMRAKLLWALAASHFWRNIGVPVNMVFCGSGLHAWRTSRQVDNSSLGGRLDEDGSPMAGFHDRLRPSEWTRRWFRLLVVQRSSAQ